MTDNSYKLFASPPTPGTPVPGGHSSQSAVNLPNEQRTTKPNETTPTSANSESKPAAEAPKDGHSTTSGGTTATPAKSSESIKGPWRLLRLLPRESRHIVGMMLKLNPRERATLKDVLSDDWVCKSAVCSQDESGRVCKAGEHTHTLEPGAAVPAAQSVAKKHP